MRPGKGHLFKALSAPQVWQMFPTSLSWEKIPSDLDLEI